MSRVRTYSGPVFALRGLGEQIYDPVTGTYVDSLPSSDNPLAPVPFVGPPLPSGAFTTAQATPSDLQWLLNNATAGDALQAATSLPAVSRPSPVVSVPLSASSMGLWFEGSTAGIPNVMLLAGAGIAALLLLGGGGGRRRR